MKQTDVGPQGVENPARSPARLLAAVARADPSVRAHYRTLHRQPELSWEEEQTAAYVELTLGALGLTPRRIAGTGVVVDLEGADPSLPMRLLRADLDAIVGQEASGLECSSERDGVMHGCGHDAHTAILLGAAAVLCELEEERRRPLRLLFQPAEETNPSGAPLCIDEGVLSGVHDVVSLHVWPALQTGKVGLRRGVVTAAADRWECILRGPGGHSARPHETVDLVALAASIVTDLVDLPRRHCDPLRQTSVVTVATISGGDVCNVIPAQVRFGGTVRALDDASRQRIEDAMESVARAAAQNASAEIDWIYDRGAPALTNDPTLVAEWERHVEAFFPDGTDVEIDWPSLGSEDFAYFCHHRPGLLLRLGCSRGGEKWYPLHSPHFVVDEGALAVGVSAMAALGLGAPRA